MSQDLFTDSIFSSTNLPPTSHFWGEPRNPTPGSTFKMSKNPLGNAGGSSRNGEVMLDASSLITHRLPSRLKNIKDVQMKIPYRHAEKKTGGKGRSGKIFGDASVGGTGTLFDTVSGGGSSGVFGAAGMSSIMNANGGHIGGTMSLAPTASKTYGNANGISTLGEMGFVINGMEDEDEMNTVSGYHSNGQIVGPEYLIISPPGIECPGQDDILIQEDKSYRKMDVSSHFFKNYLSDMQGYGKNFDGHFGFHVAGFNYYVASLQSYPPMNSQKECWDMFKLHRDIIHHFSVLGVINSETYATGGASFALDSNIIARDADRASMLNEKSVNVVGEGEVYMKNLFGPVTAGCHLWLIWKKKALPDNYIPDTRRERSAILFGQNFNKKILDSTHQQTKHTLEPFQLVPFCNPRNPNPTLEDLAYTSDHESWYQAKDLNASGRAPLKHFGVAFYVGQVTKPERSMKYPLQRQMAEIKNTCNQATYDYSVGNDDIMQVLVDPKKRREFMRIADCIHRNPEQVRSGRDKGEEIYLGNNSRPYSLKLH